MNLLWTAAVTAFVLFNTASPIRKRQKIYDIVAFSSNSTRRDIINDVVGFVAGAWQPNRSFKSEITSNQYNTKM